jgi:alcohol dehydrogenase
MGCRRVFLVTSKSVAAQPELMAGIRANLGELLVGEFLESVAHVPLATVDAASASAREKEADLILSIGGGSPVDCGKAVAVCAPSTEPAKATLSRFAIEAGNPDQTGPRHAPLPQITVTTTLSAAEFTPTFTVTDPLSRIKVMYHDQRFTPATVVLDASVTTATPGWLWAASGVRAIDHCVEWYLSAASTPFTDALVVAALKMLWRSLPAALADPGDLVARQECQIAAWMSVYGSSNVLGGLSHAIGHQLGSHTGMTHGYTSCVILPHVIEFNSVVTPQRVADLARAVGLPDDDLASGLRRLLDQLRMPRTIADATDRDVDIDAIAQATMTEVAIVNNPRKVRVDDVRKILELAR